jgi:mono/diheme cytochrome c family protein
VTRVLAALLVAFAAPAAADEADAPEDYALHCSACHGLDGTGLGFVPTLHGLEPLLTAPAGRDYLARVPGVAQAPLSDERLARLLNWVLVRFSDARVEPPYTAAEVGRLRASPLRDPAASRPGRAAGSP